MTDPEGALPFARFDSSQELDELQRQDTVISLRRSVACAFQGFPCLSAKAELLAPPESLADELWEKVAEWLDQCPLLEALDPRDSGSHHHNNNHVHSRHSCSNRESSIVTES